MRLLILSDLHLELWKNTGPRVGTLRDAVDAVILAGDIDANDNGIFWAEKTFPDVPVLYVAGNHEFYGHAIQDVEKHLIESAKSTPNVTYLSCSDFVLNGYRFLGTTLWTDYELFGVDQKHHAMHMAKDVLADYRFIRKQKQSGDFITPEDTILRHRQHVTWLEARLQEPFAGKTIVITHMAPSIQSITKQYINDHVSAGFASNLEALVKKADLWVHGHIHESMDYMVGDCRVVANPCGYRTKGGRAENWDFNPNLVVNI